MGVNLRIDSLLSLHAYSNHLNVALGGWGLYFFVLYCCTHSRAVTLNLPVLTAAVRCYIKP